MHQKLHSKNINSMVQRETEL